MSALLPCAEVSASPLSPGEGGTGHSGATGVAEAAVQLGIAAGNSITHCICHCKPLSDFPLLSMKFCMSTTCQ